MKKLALCLVLSTLGLSTLSYAADPISERRAIIKKLEATNAKRVEIGFNYGVESKVELFYWANQYLPLANYLTQQSGQIVSLVPETNKDVFSRLIKAQKYKWLYVRSDLAVLAQEFGYTPIVKTLEGLDSVTVVAAESKFKTLTDLNDKKLGYIGESANMVLARYAYNKAGAKINYVPFQGALAQPTMVAKLIDGEIDAFTVRNIIAQKLISTSENKLRVLDSNGTAPMGVILAHVSVTDKEINDVSSAFVKLNDTNPEDVTIMTRAKHAAQKGHYYEFFSKDHLKEMRTAMTMAEPDYGRYVYNPVSDSYVELYSIFDTNKSTAAAPPAPTGAKPVTPAPADVKPATPAPADAKPATPAPADVKPATPAPAVAPTTPIASAPVPAKAAVAVKSLDPAAADAKRAEFWAKVKAAGGTTPDAVPTSTASKATPGSLPLKAPVVTSNPEKTPVTK